MSRMWKSTGKRQADGAANGQGVVSKRHRLTDRVRVLAGSVKWSYLEMEDELKCGFWRLFSSSRARCNNEDCPSCNPRAADAAPARDGRISALLQKIRTWPKFGSRRIRDHTPQGSFGPLPPPDRLKAASFPVKHKDLSRARFLPRIKKFESIHEESDHAASGPKDNDVLYMNVVGLEIAAGQDAVATPSVEDLGKYSYSFGSDSLSFGNRDDSMAKDADARSSSIADVRAIAAPADVRAVAAPADVRAVAAPADVRAVAAPVDARGVAIAGSSAGPQGYDSTWLVSSSLQTAPRVDVSESPEQWKPCAAQGEAVPQSRFSGVRWKAKKWTSEIRPTGAKKTVWLGTYATEEEAASAYDAGIFYFDKPKNYNFSDSETYLPPLNPSLDERSQLNFIKTQARLIAKKRAEIMAWEEASQAVPPVYFKPDTSSSRAGPASSIGEPPRSRMFFFPSFTRAYNASTS